MPATLPQTSPPPEGALARTFRAAAHVMTTRQVESTVLLDLRRGVYYTLNELGWRIWEQIGAGVPIGSVVRTLRQEYDVPADTFELGVAGFVNDLLRASLIEPVES